MKRILLFLVLSAALCSCVREEDVPAPGQAEPFTRAAIIHSPQGARPGAMIVKFRESVADSVRAAGTVTRSGALTSGLAKVDRVLASIGATSLERVFPHAGKREPMARSMGMHLWYRIHFDRKAPLEKTAFELADIPGIETVEYSIPVVSVDDPALFIPYSEPLGPVLSASAADGQMPFDDPMLPDQWHYDNDGSIVPKAIAGADINLFEAWKKCTGSREVIVAVVDKGVDYEHPDLKDNMWINEAELSGVSGKDDDGNSYKDDIYGFDFTSSRGKIDVGDHGTHVAGTIAAVNGNGTGVSGVAGGSGSGDGVRIMTCGIFSSDGYGAGADAVGEAIYYAANNGAVICQNSWGYEAGAFDSDEHWSAFCSAEKAAIDYFIETAGYEMVDGEKVQTGPLAGGIVIFSAGNDGYKTKTRPAYPAAYPPVLSVAAMASDYTPSWFTCYGTWVDVTAPGGDETVSDSQDRGQVLSTWPHNFPGGGYAYAQGTSMACPHVSGIAALAASYALEVGAQLTGNALKSIIEECTHNFDDRMVGQKTVTYRGQTYHLDMTDYRGFMGSGYVDAALVLDEIDGMSGGNSAPKLKPLPGEETRFEAQYWETRTIEFSVTDRNEDPWTVNLVDPDGMCGYTTDSGSLTVTVFADKVGAGVHKASVSVSDDKGASSETYDIVCTVLSNAAPSSTPIENIYVQTLRVPAKVDLAEHFFDPNDPLAYMVEAVSVSTLRPSDAVKVAVYGSKLDVEAVKYGLTQITVTATDRGGLKTEQTFRVMARSESSPVDMYPNPVSDYLNIRMGRNVDGNIEVKILSAAGMTVYNRTVSISPFQPARIPVGNLARGSYIVEVTWQNSTYKGNIVKK